MFIFFSKDSIYLSFLQFILLSAKFYFSILLLHQKEQISKY